VDIEGAAMRVAEGSLPVTLTSLVGRQRELRDLAATLYATRLLTLVGTGGSGKTRLSIALPSAARHRFPQGAWWVDLAGVTGREQLPGAVAAALGSIRLAEIPQRTVLIDRRTGTTTPDLWPEDERPHVRTPAISTTGSRSSRQGAASGSRPRGPRPSTDAMASSSVRCETPRRSPST
jgi:hypothetical protein